MGQQDGGPRGEMKSLWKKMENTIASTLPYTLAHRRPQHVRKGGARGGMDVEEKKYIRKSYRVSDNKQS